MKKYQSINSIDSIDSIDSIESIVRAYDIRGVAGTEIDDDIAYHIGLGFALMAQKAGAKSLALGYDGRHSSPHLSRSLADGILDGGLNLLNVGLGPSPMLYYAVYSQDVDGGVMVTASHNPPDYNGFKFMLGKQSFYGEDLKKMARLIADGLTPATQKGQEKSLPLAEKYAIMLASHAARYKAQPPITAIWDAGNGAAGAVLPFLLPRLADKNYPLFETIDGNFPHHHPDPTLLANLQDVMTEVQKKQADVGFSFDGDGDRLGIVTKTGRMIPHDALAALLARSVLKERGAGLILADIKAGFVVRQEVEKFHGTLELSPSGHSIIKQRLHDSGALFAAEMSGHIFFTEPYYGFDDALYAALRFLHLMKEEKKTSDELLDELPRSFHSGEIRLACTEQQKQKAMAVAREEAEIIAAQEGAKLLTMDGVRLDGKDGWWLLRASNTQDVLSMTVEGREQQHFDHCKNQLRAVLQKADLSPPAFNLR